MSDTEPGGHDLDEVRAAAGEVVASLKKLVEAAEHVISDREAFAGAVDSGRSVVQAFFDGFNSQVDDDGTEPPSTPSEPAEPD